MIQRRVIIVGLDGATFEVIDPLLAQGKLPVIDDLVNRGVKARLHSTIPYATMPAWPSFMTGKNPGKHGVFDFFSFVDGMRRISNSLDIRAATLWEILTRCGKRSIVMNVPGTFPPAKINGVVVSGMLTPAGATFVSPPEVKQFLDQVTHGYRVSFRSDLSGRQLVEDVHQVTEKQKAGFLALLKSQEWDLAMIVLSATDVIQHRFWGMQDVLAECYRRMDGVVSEIAGQFPDAAIVLISDHGFQGQRKDFHVNKWLIDQGYMCVKKGTATEVSRWREIGKLEGQADLADDQLGRLGASELLLTWGLTKRKLRRFVPNHWWDALKEMVPQDLRHRIPVDSHTAYEVDWDRTQASGYQLYGAESKAIKAMSGDQPTRERICTELVEKLTDLRDPQTGDRIVRCAYGREELYTGPWVHHGPDIILDLHDGYNITNAFFAENYVTRREQVRGCHHREGILIACGNDIQNGIELDCHASLLDVMPTVLHYLACPVPDDCDGRVLNELFDADSEVRGREVLAEKMDWKERVAGGPVAYPDDDQAEIEERLRALGYL